METKKETFKKVIEELLKLDNPQLLTVEGVLKGMELERSIQRIKNGSC